MDMPLSRILENTRVTLVKNNDPVITAPPLTGVSIAIDPNLDLYQQVTQYFEELGYEVPKPSMRTAAVSMQFEDIVQQARELGRELERTGDAAQKVLLKLPKALATSTSGVVNGRWVEDGRAHIEKIGGLIDKIHTGYQKDFGEIIKKHTQFMQAVNGGLAKMSSHIISGDKGEIKLFKDEAINDINESVKGLFQGIGSSNPHFKQVVGDDDTDYTTMNRLEDIFRGHSGDSYAEDALKYHVVPLHTITYSDQAFSFWQKKLEGQGFMVLRDGDKIKVYPDVRPLRKIYDSVHMYGGTNYPEVQTQPQIYQAMQTGIDSQKNAVQSSVTRVLETFRQDNSHFDTLTQLLVQLIKDLNQYNIGLVNM